MPLATNGTAIQIFESLRAGQLYEKECTVNDCKVVVNHLIRKFPEPLGRTVEGEIRKSRLVIAGGGGKTVSDHAVPFIVLLGKLRERQESTFEVLSENESRWRSFSATRS